jgi:hypothetical protein
MSRLIALLIMGLVLTVHALPVWASCTTHTYMYGGRMVMCTTCCIGSSCTTNCF